jgi:hypothetical protein
MMILVKVAELIGQKNKRSHHEQNESSFCLYKKQRTQPNR